MEIYIASNFYKFKIYICILFASLMVPNAFAGYMLGQEKISILKQFNYEDYQAIEKKIRAIDVNISQSVDSYIDLLMVDQSTKKKHRYLRDKNKEVAGLLNIKVNKDSNKEGIPREVLSAFNLVQAIIYFYTRNPPIISSSSISLPLPVKNDIQNSLIDIIDEYTTTKIRDLYDTDTASVKNSEPLMVTLRDFKNKVTNINVNNNGNFFREMPLFFDVERNNVSVYRNLRPLDESTLKPGDKIIERNLLDKRTAQSPVRNPASKAREIYLAVNNLQSFLNKKYPNKFELSVDDNNMFKVSLNFVAPYGWWQGAFFRIIFYFDNIDDEGPEVNVGVAPPVSHLFGNDLCMMQIYKDSLKYRHLSVHETMMSRCSNRVRYGSNNYSIEQLIIQVINFMVLDFDIKEEGILTPSPNVDITYNLESIVNKISDNIHTNNLKASIVDTKLDVQTDHEAIRSAVLLRTKDEKEPEFDYLVYDESEISPEIKNGNKPSKTRIFSPVEMHRTAEIVEFKPKEIKNYQALVSEARKKTSFHIGKYIEPTVYFEGKTFGEKKTREKITAAKEISTRENKKRTDKQNSKLSMIVKVPNYEKHAFKQAADIGLSTYIPEYPNSLYLQNNDAILDTQSARERNIKWEIHLIPGDKKRAKKNNMVNQYKLIIPRERKLTERYWGGSQYGGQANTWIPTLRKDMSEAEKDFAVSVMHDLSQKKFALPNEKKYNMANEGNNIITKSLLFPDADANTWLPTQAYLEFLLQRVQMSILISKKDYSIAEDNSRFF